MLRSLRWPSSKRFVCDSDSTAIHPIKRSVPSRHDRDARNSCGLCLEQLGSASTVLDDRLPPRQAARDVGCLQGTRRRFRKLRTDTDTAPEVVAFPVLEPHRNDVCVNLVERTVRDRRDDLVEGQARSNGLGDLVERKGLAQPQVLAESLRFSSPRSTM